MGMAYDVDTSQNQLELQNQRHRGSQQIKRRLKKEIWEDDKCIKEWTELGLYDISKREELLIIDFHSCSSFMVHWSEIE